MPISRYDLPAQQNVQNTYVPLPYAELAHSLKVKQNEYDILKQTTEQADKELMGIKVPTFIRTSTDYSPTGTTENPQLRILQEAQAQFAQEKEDLLNSGIDYTTPEGKKAVSQYVNKVATFRNTAGKQIEQDSDNIKKHNEYHDKYLEKGVNYNGNAYYADRNVDKFLNQGAGFEVTSLNPYQERTKIVGDALKDLKSQVISHKDERGIVHLTDKVTGAKIGTLENNKITWSGVTDNRVKNAFKGVFDSELDEGLKREAKSYVEFLLTKNSDKILDEKGNVKNITYKTKDSKGKSIEVTDPADKYYYNQKYNKGYKELEDFAVNVFTSSDVESSRTNKFLPEAFQEGGEKDPRLDLARPLFMGEGIINGEETPDYTKAPKEGILSPLHGGYSSSFGTTIGGKDIPSPSMVDQQLLKKAQSGNSVDVHKYWESADPYYKQVSDKYKSSVGNKALTFADYKNIQQITANNRQTLQANLNVPLSDEYQGDRLDKDVIATNALAGAVIRNAKGEIIPKEELLKRLNGVRGENSNKPYKEVLRESINAYQLPVGKQPGGYNMNLNGENLFVEYSNPKAKGFVDGIKDVTDNIYDIKKPANKDIAPAQFIQAGFFNELNESGVNPSTVKNVKFTVKRDDLNINNSVVEMSYTDNKGVKKTLEKPIFGEGSVTELTKYISPLTGNTRDITSGNLPKAKTPEYDNQEFE